MGDRFELNVTLSPLAIKMELVGTVKLHINNSEDDKVAYKVKSSDNKLFRVNPPLSFLEPGETKSIQITRSDGPAGKCKMYVMVAKAKDYKTPKQAVDAAPKSEIHQFTIFIDAAKSGVTALDDKAADAVIESKLSVIDPTTPDRAPLKGEADYFDPTKINSLMQPSVAGDAAAAPATPPPPPPPPSAPSPSSHSPSPRHRDRDREQQEKSDDEGRSTKKKKKSKGSKKK